MAGLRSWASRSIVIGFEPSALATTMSPYRVGSSASGLGADQLVREPGPVAGPRGVAADRSPNVSWIAFRAVRVGGIDLAVRQVGDPAVGGRPERIRQSSAASRPTRSATAATSRRAMSKRSGASRGTARNGIVSCIGSHHSGRSQRGRRRAGACVGEHPSSRCSGSRTRRVGLHPLAHEPVEVVARSVWRRHADRPSLSIGDRASASRAARIALIARWSRERTVPGGTPRASAASSRLNPR